MGRRKLYPKSILSLALVTIIAITALVGVSQIDNLQTFFGQAQSKPANLHIFTKQVSSVFPKPWQNLAQGGEEKTYQLSSVSPSIKALSPEYIRIDHIYDYHEIVSRSPSGQLSYNWTQLDQMLNGILATGAKPFISLSYMPPAISSGGVTSPPRDWQEWSQVVQATVEHISGKNHTNLNDVYYEVWNEPDLFGGWKTYGSKNYLTLYQYAVLGAKNARQANPFKIGGPATTALYPNWVKEFLAFTKEQKLQLDFYSWHQYDFDSTAINQSVSQFNQLAESLISSPLPIIISEWGISSGNNPAYDTNTSAAHAVSVVSQLDPSISRAFAFEIQDGKDPAGQEYWGRWGLLTHADFGSHQKPRYHAFQWLAQLGRFKPVLTGQGSHVTAIAGVDTAGTLIVLVANYDPKGDHAETVPVTFHQLTRGTYTLTQQYLGRPPQSQTLTISEDTHTLSLPMPPNSVHLLKMVML